ncbi:hypothetical protein MKEN_00737700 [Mycena kentingensis (nom. inval.)]|nr:hypothetical protein MKEN_00737700 [Mycena kentingensis (nom. inval.)]
MPASASSAQPPKRRGRPSEFSHEEEDFLRDRVAGFLQAQREKVPGIYVRKVARDFLEKWPVEVPPLEPDSALDAMQATQQQAAEKGKLEVDKKQKIATWFNNQGTKNWKQRTEVNSKTPGSIAMGLFKWMGKRSRRRQEIEIFQQRNHDKLETLVRAAIDEEVKARGDNVDLDPEDTDDDDDEAARGNEKLSSLKMRVRRRVVGEQWAAESELEKTAVNEIYRAQPEATDAEVEALLDGKTPEDIQRAIDELKGILKEVHECIFRLTGWMGVTLLGGPLPEDGGRISVETFAAGQTSMGMSLPESLKDWGNVVHGAHLWLRRIYTSDMRQARALPPKATATQSSAPTTTASKNGTKKRRKTAVPPPPPPAAPSPIPSDDEQLRAHSLGPATSPDDFGAPPSEDEPAAMDLDVADLFSFDEASSLSSHGFELGGLSEGELDVEASLAQSELHLQGLAADLGFASDETPTDMPVLPPHPDIEPSPPVKPQNQDRAAPGMAAQTQSRMATPSPSLHRLGSALAPVAEPAVINTPAAVEPTSLLRPQHSADLDRLPSTTPTFGTTFPFLASGTSTSGNQNAAPNNAATSSSGLFGNRR